VAAIATGPGGADTSPRGSRIARAGERG
jgi:hypothetical protein